MQNRIAEIFNQHIALFREMLSNTELQKQIEQISRALIDCYQQGGSVYFCGNGGSAADSQHLSTELAGRFYKNRAPLNAEALHVNSSFLTAVANDFGYDKVFERAIEAKAKPKDVLIAMSTSGNSINVIAAVKKAIEIDVVCIGFTGAGPNSLIELSDLTIAIQSKDTPRIQEAHLLIGHIICELVEDALFPNA